MRTPSFRNQLLRALNSRQHPGFPLASSPTIRRYFSVKELSWCAPTDSPVRRQVRLRRRDGQRSGSAEETNESEQPNWQPIDRFGIVAAMASESRVIGVNGKLPWRQSLDRKIFKNLTKHGILIVGRRTLQDELDLKLGHVRHAKYCIVVSTSVSSVDELLGGSDASDNNQVPQKDRDWEILRLVGSLDEALDAANRLSAEIDNEKENEKDSAPSFPSPFSSDFVCWVAGGERLFDEALKHPSAKELHLSTIDVDVDASNVPDNVAKFPAKYRWDHNYRQVFQKDFDHNNDNSDGDGEYSLQPDEPTFSYQVYQRIERNKSQRQ